MIFIGIIVAGFLIIGACEQIEEGIAKLCGRYQPPYREPKANSPPEPERDCYGFRVHSDAFERILRLRRSGYWGPLP
jgi:hypothetical protein